MNHKILMAVVTALMLGGCGDDAPVDAPDDQVARNDAPLVEEQAMESKPPALPRTASLPGAGVFFITPADGDTVKNPIAVEFGIDGMSVTTAGDNAPYTGHHHLIVDAELPDFGLPIPVSENYIHFGDGSTSTELNLTPGTHTLRLLLGDYLHIPHDPPVKSASITIVVE